MKSEVIQSLTDSFEADAQETEGAVEFWLARDLQHLLGYASPNTAWIQSLIDTYKSKTYTSKHIRPLAVSPLNHPESVPTPWGFLISGPGIDASTLILEVNA